MSGKKKAMSGDQSKKTLKRVLSYIRPYRAAVLLSLFLALVTVVLTLYVPILTGQAVDRIVGAGAVDFAGLWGVLKRIFLVVALTAIAGYAVPRLYEPLSLLRLVFLLTGGLLGVWGVTAGLLFLLMDLCGAESFGVPLLSPVSPLGGRLALRDVLVRASWRRLSRWDARVQDMPGARKEDAP